MSQEGYANPITNNGPGFHSIIPVSELIERVTRAQAIEASDVSSAPLIARNRGRGNAQNSKPTPTKAQWGSRAQDTQNTWVYDPKLAPSLGYASTTHQTPGSTTPNSPHPSATLRLHTKRLGL